MLIKFKRPSNLFMTSRMLNGPIRQEFRTLTDDFEDAARENNVPLQGRIAATEDTLTAARAQLKFREEQLQEAKSEKEAATAEAQLLNNTMTDLILGTEESMVIRWNKIMAMTRRNKKRQQKEFEQLIEHLLKHVTNWKKVSHGGLRNGEHHANAMIALSVYFYPHKFNMKQYASMFALSTVSHNMVVAIEILLKEKILEESKNNLQKTVYGLVASISSNIDYREQDEDVIDKEFIRMIAEGNREATNKQVAKNKAKRKRTNGSQQDESNTDSNEDDPSIVNV